MRLLGPLDRSKIRVRKVVIDIGFGRKFNDGVNSPIYSSVDDIA